jgi:outer membrane protein insertion porin family
MGIALLLSALVAQAPVTERIASVEVRLLAGADPRLLQNVASLVSVRKGQPLSRRAIQHSIETLYASARFSDVVVSLESQEDGTVVVFEVEPQRKIERVTISGSAPLSAELLQELSGLREGQAYSEEASSRAAEQVREGLQQRGFASAQVDAQVDLAESGNVIIELMCRLGAPTLLEEVVFEGDLGLPRATLLRTLGFQPQSRLDLNEASAGVDRIRELLRENRFYKARIDTVDQPRPGTLRVVMVAGPQYQMVFRGNRTLSTKSLRSLLAYAGDETLDEGVVRRLRLRIERFYQSRGFFNVRVHAVDVVAGSAGQVVFSIEESDAVRLSKVSFIGNRRLSNKVLQDILTQVSEAKVASLPFDVHGTGDPLRLEGTHAASFAEAIPTVADSLAVDLATFSEAAQRMTAEYRNRGYLFASVRWGEVDVVNNTAAVSFRVDEGAEVKVGLFEVRGMPTGVKVPTQAVLSSQSVLRAGRLEQSAEVLRAELTARGYLYAKVKPAFVFDRTQNYADCTLEVSPGPMVTARRVLLVGNVYTKDSIVSGQLTLKENAPISSVALAESQNNLLASGLYRTAQIELLSPDVAEPLKTVVVKVTERPRITYELGLGYFLADGPRLVADVLAPNVAGRAISLNGHLQMNFFSLSAPALTRQVDVADLTAIEQLGGRGNVSAQNRGLLPLNIGWRFDLVGERVFRPQFRFTRFAAVPTLDWSQNVPLALPFAQPKLTLQLQYEAEWSSVLRTSAAIQQSEVLTAVDQARLRFLFGVYALQTGRMTATLDVRDNALVPRRGFLLQGTADLTGALFTSDERGAPVPVNFVKTSGLLTGYIPFENAVLALSGRAGRIFALTDGSVTPPVKRFFMGGATSMRGFNEDQLLAADLRAQYRRELNSCLSLASQAGCSGSAVAIASGRQVPSQGGEFFVLMKSELRFPVGFLDLGLFFELGNLWLSLPENGLPLRSSAGLGARYVTPVGPFALDIGFNLNPDRALNEPFVVGHFNIGVF